MADGSRNGGNQQFGAKGVLNLQVCDQRYPVSQPRGETLPIQENQNWYGTASFQSILETDGNPTFHNGVSVQANSYEFQVGQDVVSNGGAPLSSDTGQCIQETSQGIDPAVGPCGNLSVGQDVVSNGGAPLSSDTGQCIQETSQDLNATVPKIQEPERNASRELSDSDLTNVQIRIKSFEKAPLKLRTGQFKPETFAEQGLYYTGFRDETGCFNCNTFMREWEVNDDPLIEHIRHGPEQICSFLQATINHDFLHIIKENLKDKGNQSQMTKMPNLPQDQQKPKVPETAPMKSSTYSSNKQASGLENELFICQDCCKNIVDHTQLECGHNICSKCIKDNNLKDRCCKTCGRPVLRYAPYSPCYKN